MPRHRAEYRRPAGSPSLIRGRAAAAAILAGGSPGKQATPALRGTICYDSDSNHPRRSAVAVTVILVTADPGIVGSLATARWAG